ncbi:MAG: DUF6263 family protein [Bacteroidales bacterium]|jgi:hypothetical protein|nr:DUF6263 family protein [Bacteroidales bacterium]MDD3700290.1 DUF6263 family protein [Bacteroidales bacterium]MDY0368520.1 DUF6263 family protein [Bacteroidales bacterium]
MKKSYLLFSFVFLLKSISLFALQDIELSYNLKVNKKYALEIVSVQTITMELMGQTMTVKQQSTVDQEIRIADEINEGYKLEIESKRIQIKQNTMGMEFKWDSKYPETDDPMVKQLANQLIAAIESVTYTTIEKNGMPIHTEGSELQIDKGNISGFESGMMIVFPNKPIKPGESWETEFKPDSNSDFIITSTYTLEEIKGNQATISFDGTLSGSQIMGQNANISGNITGKSKIDIRTGWMIDSAVHQTIQTIIEQEGMQIPMKIDNFTEVVSK